MARSRSSVLRALFLLGAGLVVLVLLGLGTWQVQRLSWKLDLIERVEQRVHAAPVAPPAPARWADINAANDEYRHLRLQGRWLHQHSSLVQAVTKLGPGFWVMTPLRLSGAALDGQVVWVNRGFVTQAPGPRAPDDQDTTVTGLLRLSEPGGGFLRRNDPAAQRWFSRDVQALSAAHGLQGVAPYFVDADAATSPLAGQSGALAHDAPLTDPVGGLTVLHFQNNHLVYALTWYALALMVIAAVWWVWRQDRRGASA
ncbi:SURF1 family protein [Curvibacter sp. HBC61]|uniref:SURF1-like protein n=1 Tax=Curvibacter cyanobacteriorum TaxID=3026422 RepID=A0ABT5MTR6_9BURK|nr:SURF1 family protein [Curvibacter sp. HBC61]MDD0837438.1 SURF1 family protein [Curvibacter sp. HBC61]